MKMFMSVWKKLIALVRAYPVIIVPFIIVAAIDVVVLIILYLSPRPPLSIVIAPVIRSFWGEQYNHYPSNLLLLPGLFNYVRTALSLFTGVILTAISMAFVGQAYEGISPKWSFGIKKAVQRYLRLFFVWGITLGAILLSLNLAGAFIPAGISRKAAFLVQFPIGIFFQTLLLFAIPSIIVENRKIFPAILRSLNLCSRHSLPALLIVLIPGLLFVPLTFVDSRLSFFMERTTPEIVLYILFARIFVICFIDFLVSVSAVTFLLVYKDQEEIGGAQS